MQQGEAMDWSIIGAGMRPVDEIRPKQLVCAERLCSQSNLYLLIFSTMVGEGEVTWLEMIFVLNG